MLNTTRKASIIAIVAIAAIAVHLVLRFGVKTAGEIRGVPLDQIPLIAALVFGGIPLVAELLVKLIHGQFGSDLLAGMSIVTAALLGEYLAGALVVLMLSGGEALEAYAVRSASSVLGALAKRMPTLAHRKLDSNVTDLALSEVSVGDALLVFPHEICPVDGTVVEGRGVMDEFF